MKVIIAGGRDFNDYNTLVNVAESWPTPITEVISRKAKGADNLGEEWANECDVPIKEFPANWDKYGKPAGYIRNEQMAKQAEGLLAFWDGKSKGTKHMIDLAIKYNLFLKVLTYE